MYYTSHKRTCFNSNTLNCAVKPPGSSEDAEDSLFSISPPPPSSTTHTHTQKFKNSNFTLISIETENIIPVPTVADFPLFAPTQQQIFNGKNWMAKHLLAQLMAAMT